MQIVLPTRVRSLAALACLLVLAGCSSPPSDPPAPAAAPTAGHGSGHGGESGHGGGHGSGAVGLYAVQSGPLGVVATDSDGHLLYRSDADSAAPPASACTDACAQTFLPLVVADSEEPELLGVDAELVGELERADGTVQLTLAGWPLYHHRDDDGGLTTTGEHGVGGWFAVTPKGEKAAAA